MNPIHVLSIRPRKISRNVASESVAIRYSRWLSKKLGKYVTYENVGEYGFFIEAVLS